MSPDEWRVSRALTTGLYHYFSKLTLAVRGRNPPLGRYPDYGAQQLVHRRPLMSNALPIMQRYRRGSDGGRQGMGIMSAQQL